MSDGLDDLRALHPDWTFGVAWMTRASGPDLREVYAKRDGETVLAHNAAGLALRIRDAGNAAR